MATKVETRPMSPFVRARASTDGDTTTKLHALIDKVSTLIEEEQKHNKALQESIYVLSIGLHTQISVLTRTATTLESRITTLESTLLKTLEERNQIHRERDFLLALFQKRKPAIDYLPDDCRDYMSPGSIDFHITQAKALYDSWEQDWQDYLKIRSK